MPFGQRLPTRTGMDDYEVERIGSDNPALAVPAAQCVQSGRQRCTSNIKSTTTRSDDTLGTEASHPPTKHDVSTDTFIDAVDS
jgi:hypothetical protein